MRVVSIFRHPVKSVGSEPLERVALRAGQPMPGDRAYALRRSDSDYDGGGAWADCHNFARIANAPRLAQVSLALEPETQRLAARHPERPAFGADLSESDGRAALAAWLEPLAAPALTPPFAIVAAAPSVAYVDDPDGHVSIMTLTSLAALSELAGLSLDRRRFRGNFWIEGRAAWEELDWVGREIRLGPVRLELVERIERCLVTAANPETGARDAHPPKLLEAAYGHKDFGVLARIVSDGEIAVGDAVELI